MAAPTVARQDCAGFPSDHSVEDHLDAERAALATERRVALGTAAQAGRWMMLRAVGLGLALAGTIAFGLSHLNR